MTPTYDIQEGSRSVSLDSEEAVVSVSHEPAGFYLKPGFMQRRQLLSTQNVREEIERPDDDGRSVSTYRSRMDRMKGRLNVGSVFGDSSSIGPVDDQGRLEVARKKSALLLKKIEDR